MTAKEFQKAIEHNKNVLRSLGIAIPSVEKGMFNVSLLKRSVRRKNLTSGEYEQSEIFYLNSDCGKINFPADLLVLTSDKVSTKLEINNIEYNPKGYISKVIGCFQSVSGAFAPFFFTKTQNRKQRRKWK